MRDLVLFPFSRLFQLFHGTIRTEEPEKIPVFQKASVVAALDLLEDFYYALYTADKIDSDEVVSKELAGKLLTTVRRHTEQDEDTLYIGSDDPETFIKDIQNLKKKTQQLLKSVPFPQLIRALREDPYYRMRVHIPELEIRDFYLGMKKLSLRNEVDEVIREVRSEALSQERSELFKGKKMKALHYYRVYSSIDYEKLGISKFRYYQGILVLYNFLLIDYKGPIQKILQIMETYISEQDRITHERLLKHASAAEDVLYKIRELDDSLSSEQDEGKKFQKLRFEHGLDSVQQRMYQDIIIRKDHEALDMFNKGREALRGLRLLLQDFLENSDTTIQEALRRKYLFQGKIFVLYEMLKLHIEKMRLLEQIEQQLDQIRDETGFDEGIL